ncbi:YkgJ family cysteine cluster protein [Desulfofundulus thermocisternus]|nr:YkgJ family cysteine cluster protein [Desulfofundulus thermocisternus]
MVGRKIFYGGKMMSGMNIDSCIRCGTCCRKGGPVLHHEDKEILRAGYLNYRHLVTIRKGEPAFDPVREEVRPVERELVKVRGKGGEWTCFFFDEENSSCTIYEHRPLECRLQRCWDTPVLESLIGRDTIVRADIINAGDPILEVMEMHERECSYQEVEELLDSLSGDGKNQQALARLNELARRDLAIRLYAIRDLGLDEDYELFIFGRPLFKVLASSL